MFALTCKHFRLVCLSSVDTLLVTLSEDPFKLQRLLALFPSVHTVHLVGQGTIDYSEEVGKLKDGEHYNVTSLYGGKSTTLGSNFVGLLCHCGM